MSRLEYIPKSKNIYNLKKNSFVRFVSKNYLKSFQNLFFLNWPCGCGPESDLERL